MAEEQDVQVRNRRKSDQPEKVRGIRIRTLNVIMIVVACAIVTVFFFTAHSVRSAYTAFEFASNSYVECEQAASDLQEGSNYLTAQTRSYVVTHNRSYVQRFSDEVASQRRENAVQVLRENMQSDEAAGYLEESLEYSQDLTNRELYAIALVANGLGQNLTRYSDLFNDIKLTPEDEALSDEEKVERGTMMVYDTEYQNRVDLITESVAECKAVLVESISQARDEGARTTRSLMFLEQLLAIASLASVIALIIMLTALVLRPLKTYVDHIHENTQLPMSGAYELRFMGQAYNALHEENRRTHDQLLRRAERDHLTNLYNRSVFEQSIDKHEHDPVALLLIDADYFKSVNDTLGHDVGDAMLKKVARLLMGAFRITDYPCRIGGDEFAVIMGEVTADFASVIVAKIDTVRAGLRDTSDGLPNMTISVGIAFSDGSLDSDELYKNADKALYKVKEAGRDGYAFYEE